MEVSATLKLDKDNQVSGELRSDRETLEIVEGTFVPSKKQIQLIAENDDGLTVEINGKIKGDQMECELDINGGMMEVDAIATRKKRQGKGTKKEKDSSQEKQKSQGEAEISGKENSQGEANA